MTVIDRSTLSSAGATASSGASRAQLGQDSFLRLLTAQLQNQNPLDPLNNSEFIGQMAQFSTVNGINQINATLDQMAAGGGESGLSAVSSLIGRQVLVEMPMTYGDAGGAVAGRVLLDQPSSSVVVAYSDADTGALLYSQPLGAQPAGPMAFNWQDGSLTGRHVAVSVTATTPEGTIELSPSLYGRVNGGSPGLDGAEALLDIEGYGQVSALEIQSIR